MIVLDASAALAFSFEDEKTPTMADLVDRVAGDGAYVPAIWHLEVLNAFATAVRRRRITLAQRTQLVAMLTALPVIVDEQTATNATGRTLNLADRHGLTVYDAAYLELALRCGLPLATLDTQLADAARAEGVAILP